MATLEQLLLMTVLRLRHDAYGMQLRREIHERTGEDLAIGSIYTTMGRLEKKGYVRSYRTDPTPERGGRHKRVYELTGSGERALKESLSATDSLRSGVPGLEPAFFGVL